MKKVRRKDAMVFPGGGFKMEVWRLCFSRSSGQKVDWRTFGMFGCAQSASKSREKGEKVPVLGPEWFSLS